MWLGIHIRWFMDLSDQDFEYTILLSRILANFAAYLLMLLSLVAITGFTQLFYKGMKIYFDGEGRLLEVIHYTDSVLDSLTVISVITSFPIFIIEAFWKRKLWKREIQMVMQFNIKTRTIV